MKKTYRQRQTTLLQALQKHNTARRIHVSSEQAGLHLLLTIETDFSEETLIRRAEQVNVGVTGLTSYYDTPRAAPSGFPRVVLGFAQLSEVQIKSGIERLMYAWREIEA